MIQDTHAPSSAQAMRTFLEVALPPLLPGETVELRGVHAVSHAARSTWYTDLALLMRGAALLTVNGFHTYIGVNPRYGQRRGDGNVSRVASLAADIDEKLFATQNQLTPGFCVDFAYPGERALPEETGGFRVFAIQNRILSRSADNACRYCPLMPTLAIHSGGGVQPYWCLETPIQNDPEIRARCAVLSHRLARLAAGSGRTPDNVSNTERVLRLPGTLNRKYEPARSVTLLWSDGPRYDLDGIETWLDTHAAWTAPPPPKEWAPPAPRDGVIADFKARYDALPLLLRDGAKVATTRGDVRYIVRPGKDAGVSASYGYYPGVLRMFSSEWPPFEAGHGYDAFEVFSLLTHGGDRRAAYAAAKADGYGQRFGLHIDSGSSYQATRRLLVGTGR